MAIIRVYEDDGTLLAERGTDGMSAPFTIKVIKVVNRSGPRVTQSFSTQVPDTDGHVQPLDDD